MKSSKIVVVVLMVLGLGLPRYEAQAIGKNEKAIIGAIVATKLAEGLGRSRAKSQDKKDAKKAEEQNSKISWPSLKDKNVLIRLPREITETDFPFDRQLESEFVGIIENAVDDVGGHPVIQREGLRRVTGERAEERSNPEVKQSTVAPQGTIERADFILEASVVLINSRKSQDLFYILGLDGLRGGFGGGFGGGYRDNSGGPGGFGGGNPFSGGWRDNAGGPGGFGGGFGAGDVGFSTRDVGVGIVLKLRPADSQKSLGALRARANEADATSVRLFTLPVGYYAERDDPRGRQLRALDKATQSLVEAIASSQRSVEKPANRREAGEREEK